MSVGQTPHDPGKNKRTPVPDHLQTISPACPMRCVTQPRGASQTKTSMLKGRVAISLTDGLATSGSKCRIAHKHCHNPESCACANSWTASGGTVRIQKFPLAPAQNNNKSHADCTSGTTGIRSKRVECSAVFLRKNDCTKSGCPMGDNTRIPCSTVGIPRSPVQTLASFLTNLAAAVNSSQPAGFAPALFQMLVFPWCTWMLA